jgi:hypothetical protein
MAETPEGLVYRGREGTGAAQIFGQPGQALRMYSNVRASQAKADAAKTAAQAKAKEERDKQLIQLLDQRPDKAFEPFNQEVIKAAEAHRNNIVAMASKGADLASGQLRSYNSSQWDKINGIAAATNSVKEALGEIDKIVSIDPYYKDARDYYRIKAWDRAGLDENFKAKGSVLDVNVSGILNLLNEDPSGYNIGKFMNDFIGDIDANVISFVKKQAISNGMGDEINTIIPKIKAQLYTPDPNSALGVKVDAEGKPIINVTPEFVASVMANGNAKRRIEWEAKNEGVSPQEIIKKYAAPAGALDVESKVQMKFDPSWVYRQNSGGMLPEERTLASRFFEDASALINAFVDNDGLRTMESTARAREALGNYRTAVKAGGSDVLDVQLIPGTNSPGDTRIMDMRVDNSPNDRMVFKVKTTRGLPKPFVVDLNDEGAAAALWGIYSTGKVGALNKMSYDQLASALNVNQSELYKGGLGKDNEKRTAAIQAIVDQKWMKGEGAEDFVGRKDPKTGLTIEEAEPVLSEGFMGIGGGKLEGWLVRYKENGQVGRLPADRDVLETVLTGKESPKGATTGAQQPKAIKSQSQYDALPPGSEYIDPQGNIRIKPKK